MFQVKLLKHTLKKENNMKYIVITIFSLAIILGIYAGYKSHFVACDNTAVICK